MKKLLGLTVSILFSGFFGSQLMAQDLVVENAHLFLHIPVALQSTIDVESGVDPMLQLENTSLDYVLSVVVSDPDNISAIDVKVFDDALGSEQITSHLFVYDDESPGTGLSYIRDGNSVLLGLGNFNYDATVYYEVYLVDLNGDHSNVFSKNTLQ